MWGSHGPVKRPDRAERAVTKRPLLLPAATSITRHTRATRRWARKKKNCSCVISTVTNPYTHTNPCTHTNTCTHSNPCTHTHTHTHTDRHTRTHTHKHTPTHTHTHIHIHMYIH